MKYLKIQNKGLLDLRLLSLMGGTTKSNDVFKIGSFGSGLKYSLAYLLKNNIDFKVFIGENPVELTTKIETIRDEDFEIIHVNGEKTSITTQMGGKDWKPWMIIRELWSNALDEGEEVKEVVEVFEGKENVTTFYIQMIPAFKEVWDNWTNYFVHDLTPMSVTSLFRVYAGGECLRLYKQGVLIYENKDHKSLFSYDIKSADINELREFRGSVSQQIVHSLASASKEVISYFLENINSDVYEATMDYNWYTSFGKNWKDVIGNCKIIHPKAIETIKSRGLEIDMDSCIVVPEKVYTFLTTEFPGIGALRTADKVNEFYEIFDVALDAKVKQATSLLEECGYFISPELKFIYGVFGNKDTWAKISFDTKEVFISENLRDKSLFDVVTTLIEENEHFKTGFQDCTRRFQQHFIDLYAKEIFDKNKIFI